MNLLFLSRLLKKGFESIIIKDMGNKDIKMIYAGEGTRVVKVDKKTKRSFLLQKRRF